MLSKNNGARYDVYGDDGGGGCDGQLTVSNQRRTFGCLGGKPGVISISA